MVSRFLLLLDGRGRRHAVPLDAPMAKVPSLGTVRTESLDARIGRLIDIGGRRFLVLEPSGRDLREAMVRGAQTLTHKDLATLLYETDVGPGAVVAEAGTGSGGLTVALARAVGRTGRVISFDTRQEALKAARKNVASAGVDSIVEFRVGDVRNGLDEQNLDAVILDLVNPWAAVDASWVALRACGHFASFSPNTEQVKETVAALRRQPFIDLRTVEVIEREMEVRDVGVRPSFAPLGHTGYLTFARKVLDTF